MAYLFLLLFTVFLVKYAYPAAPAGPFPQWSPKTYGVEVPWWAVRTQLGIPPQTIELLYGGSFNSIILGSSLGTTVCDAQAAVLHDSESSSTAFNYTLGPPAGTNQIFSMLATRGITFNNVFDTISAIVHIDGAPPGTISSFDMEV